PNPNRPLKVGYVSADFKTHASDAFILPLLSTHDSTEFEIFCYCDVLHGDRMTERMRQYAHTWHNTAGWSNQRLGQQIRDDGIDVLVDLKLHTAKNRLLVFAERPAPVQLTWLGYPGTTGLKCFDARLTDPFLDPPGDRESHTPHDARYTEA